jgi:hypothetical protein
MLTNRLFATLALSAAAVVSAHGGSLRHHGRGSTVLTAGALGAAQPWADTRSDRQILRAFRRMG